MSHLILVRHGQSQWNLENRFTGWVDVGLAPKGKLEACKAGELIKKLSISFTYFYSSYQTRSIETLKLILNTMRIKSGNIIKAWELNERHYGALTGLNKDEMKKKYGEEQIHTFRRSWNNPPEPLKRDSPYHPLNIDIYKNIPSKKIPDTDKYFNNAKRLNKPDENNIFIEAHSEGWNWLIPLHNGSVSVGVVVDSGKAAEHVHGANLEAFLNKYIAYSPHIADLLSNATLM